MIGRRIAAVAVLLALAGCDSTSVPHATRTPTGPPSASSSSPSSGPTDSGSPSREVLAKRERLHRQLRHHHMVVDFLTGNAEELRGASTLDGLTLDEVLAGPAGFVLAADDDVYAVRLTSLVAGRHNRDGSFDPMFEHRRGWMIRRHHIMEPVGCDKLGMPKSCKPCAEFFDYLYFFVPTLRRDPNPYGALLPSEVTTSREEAEAAEHGIKPCR